MGWAAERARAVLGTVDGAFAGDGIDPLAMTCSGVGAAGGGTRLNGHAAGRATAHWDHALPGAGGVEASISDLARYLAAVLAPPEGRLGAAITTCLQPCVRIDGQLAGGLG
jgi:CubicO group peptidase (beta-lactamase class C family)